MTKRKRKIEIKIKHCVICDTAFSGWGTTSTCTIACWYEREKRVWQKANRKLAEFSRAELLASRRMRDGGADA